MIPRRRNGAPPQRPAPQSCSGHHQAAAEHEGTAAPVRPGHHVQHDDADVRAEAWRLVDPVQRRVRERHGPIPGVGTAGWWEAPDDEVRLAALLTLALAWLVHDPERIVAERLKAASVEISAAHDLAAASRRLSHAERQALTLAGVWYVNGRRVVAS